MGDLFHPDIDSNQHYAIFDAMDQSPQHTFIILTKRINRVHIPMRDNWWLGVSISTNDDLWMVDKLLEIPAAVRFVSVEPQLEHIDLDPPQCEECFGREVDYGIDKMPYCPECETEMCYGNWLDSLNDRISWVIQGAETSHGKRPFNIQWARNLRDQCEENGVPFFFKQDGEGKDTIDGKIYQEYPE